MKFTMKLMALFFGVLMLSNVARADDADDCVKASGDIAIDSCTHVIESGRLSGVDLARAYLTRGIAWKNKKDYDHAIADFNEAIRLDPEYAIAFNNRGIAWKNKKDYDRAIADFNEAVRLNQQYEDAFNNRGIAWKNKKDYDRAIADFNEAVRLDPEYAIAFNNRGVAWYDKKDYDRAIADYTEAIRLDPEYADAFKNRGCAQFNLAKFSSAVSDLAQSQQLNPDAYTTLWLFLARSRVPGSGRMAELTLNTNDLDEKKWPAPVVALYLGKSSPDKVTSQAADPDAETNKAQRCEASFYLGEWHLLRGEKPQSRQLFTQAKKNCSKTFVEYKGAVAELERLK